MSRILHMWLIEGKSSDLHTYSRKVAIKSTLATDAIGVFYDHQATRIDYITHLEYLGTIVTEDINE